MESKIAELDKIFEETFNQARKEGIKLNDGDLIIPHLILKDKNLRGKDFIYLCSYYLNNKNLLETDKENHNFSKNELARIKKKLKKLGYIEIYGLTPEKLKKKTIELSHKGYKCEWCGKESYVLQAHHYPIPAKDGGTEIVNICPNCHYTFHLLERY